MSIEDGREPQPEKQLDQQPTAEGGGASAPTAVEAPADDAPGAAGAPDVEAPVAMEAPAARRPKVGDVVIYHVSPSDSCERHNGASELPAVVVRGWGSQCANLKILTDGPSDTWKTSVLMGGLPGMWSFRD